MIYIKVSLQAKNTKPTMFHTHVWNEVGLVPLACEDDIIVEYQNEIVLGKWLAPIIQSTLVITKTRQSLSHSECKGFSPFQ